MIGKTPKEHQMSIFEVALESFIDMNHELVLLSKQIEWEAVESEFAEYYCADNGRPSFPIRKMVGMMLLKNIYNLSDEGVVARWMENPYMQYFTGEKVFQKRPPMNPIDLTKFRKRIGTIGAEKIFKISLLVNAKEITGKEMKLVMIDSTVQVHEPFPHRDIRDINTPNLVPMVNLQPSQKIRHDVNSRSGSTQVLLRIDGLDAHLAHQEAVLKYFELQS